MGHETVEISGAVRALSPETASLLQGNHTHRLPVINAAKDAQVDQLDIGAPFLNCTGNLTITLGANCRVEELSIGSLLPSGGRGCPVTVVVGEGVYLKHFTVLDDPGDVTGGLGRCRIEVKKQPKYGRGVMVILGADWAHQENLTVIVDEDSVDVTAAAVIPVIKYFDRESGCLIIRVGFEPTGFTPRNPRG